MARPELSDRRLERVLLAFIIVVCSLQAANNVLPYFGLRDDSSQTMFSGLEWQAETNNHYLMPQHALSDRWDYHDRVVARVEPEPTPTTRQAYLADWLNQENRRLNTEATRVVVRQLCDAGHTVSLSIGDQDIENACAEPRFSEPASWIPVRLYETDVAAR